MKPITWLRKFAARGASGYPVATLVFYGPNDRKATKAVLGIIDTEGAEPRFHTWAYEVADKDLRYNVDLQNEWIKIIEEAGCKSLALLEEINGCPHQEGVDYPEGETCPKCPFWSGRERPIERQSHLFATIEQKADLVTCIATYKPQQWEAFLASAADRDALEDTWEEWNAGLQLLTAEFDVKKVPYIFVELDVDEINEFCRGEGIVNDGRARAELARRKASHEQGEEEFSSET
ncbi:MAG TPA: hypothetical protein VF020_21875 [Chthoniobacterales bacterium]